MFCAWSTISLLALWQAASTPLTTDNPVFRVVAGDSGRVEISPPQVVMRAFTVENLSDSSLVLHEDMHLPDQWKLVGDSSAFSISAHGSDLRLICVSVPSQAPPGSYLLQYFLRCDSLPSLTASTTSEVIVVPTILLEADAGKVPERILGGEDYSVQFKIRNNGNVPSPLTISPALSSYAEAKLDHTQLVVAPGSSEVVTMIVESDRNLRQPTKHRAVVNVLSPEFQQKRLQVLAPSAVEFVPRSPAAPNHYHELPTKLAMRYVSTGSSGQAQLEYSGQGTLDPRGRYRIEYRFRGPHDLERDLFGLRDEYSVRIQTKDAELRAGDHLFGLSRLTEQNILGRGARISAAWRGISGGGYYFKARSKYPDCEERAAYVGLDAHRRLSMRVNFLNKITDSANRNLASLTSTFRPFSSLNLNGEYAAGQGVSDSRQIRHSAQGQMNARLRGMQFTLEKIYAERDFPGYYRNFDQSAASAYLPITKRLRWQSSYRNLSHDFSHDQTPSASLRETDWRSGFSYSFPHGANGQLNFEDLDRQDTNEPSLYGYRERSVILFLRYPISRIALDGSIRGGRRTDYVEDYAANFGRMNVGLTYTPNLRQSYQGSFQTKFYGSSPGLRSDRIIRLRAMYRIARRLSLTAAYQRNDSPDRLFSDNNQFDVDASIFLFDNHVLSLRFRRVIYEDEQLPKGSSLMIGYEIPLSVPIMRAVNTGQVRGRLVDADDPGRGGIAGALISLDRFSTRTDARGNFTFPSVDPGKHFLQIDPASVGLHHTTTVKTPMGIGVRGGRTESATIGVTKSATIRGEIVFFGLGGDDSERGLLSGLPIAEMFDTIREKQLRRLYGLENVNVELRRADEVIRVETDENGRFGFSDIRPGTWTLTPAQADLPPFHAYEQAEYKIEIEPGTSQDILIRVLPVVRSVIVVDEGRVPVVRRTR